MQIETLPMLPILNEEETIAKCKRKLEEYPRWREIAQDPAEQRITQMFTFEPRSGSGPSKAVERLALRKVQAEQELEEIEQALSRMFHPDYRLIICRKYLEFPTSTNYMIGQELGVESTTFQKMLRNALLAFAHSYRDGILVVES